MKCIFTTTILTVSYKPHKEQNQARFKKTHWCCTKKKCGQLFTSHNYVPSRDQLLCTTRAWENSLQMQCLARGAKVVGAIMFIKHVIICMNCTFRGLEGGLLTLASLTRLIIEHSSDCRPHWHWEKNHGNRTLVHYRWICMAVDIEVRTVYQQVWKWHFGKTMH